MEVSDIREIKTLEELHEAIIELEAKQGALYPSQISAFQLRRMELEERKRKKVKTKTLEEKVNKQIYKIKDILEGQSLSSFRQYHINIPLGEIGSNTPHPFTPCVELILRVKKERNWVQRLFNWND